MKVDLAIVGVHKCATTSLLRGLGQHPELHAHFTGQTPPVFLGEATRAERVDAIDACFDQSQGSGGLIRDTSLYMSPAGVRRLVELYPDVKLVLAVRDPVQRAFSAHRYAVQKAFETREDFSAIIRAQADGRIEQDLPLICNYVAMGMYGRHLAALEAVIGIDRITVVDIDALRSDPAKVYRELFEFAGVDPSFSVEPVVANTASVARSRRLSRWLLDDGLAKRLVRQLMPLRVRIALRTTIASWNSSRGAQAPTMADEDRAYLQALYAPEMDALFRRYGIDLRTNQLDNTPVSRSAGPALDH